MAWFYELAGQFPKGKFTSRDDIETRIWTNMCTMARMRQERQRLSERLTDCDARNDTWSAGHVCGDIQNHIDKTKDIYQRLFDETKELGKQIDSKRFAQMALDAYNMYP